MGTSTSSPGPGHSVPLVPPWAPDPLPPDDDADQNEGTKPNLVPIAPEASPRARFSGARNSLRRFADSGDSRELRRAIGHYIRRGLGGASTATRRMGATIRTAGALYGALTSASEGKAAAPGSPFDPALLTGRSVEEVQDALVEAIRPVDGTLDTEASRKAILSALIEFLDSYPEAELLNLSEADRLFIAQHYIAHDVYYRFILDLGKTVQSKALSPLAVLSRLKEIKEYIIQTVSARFRALKKLGEQLSARRVAEFARQALQETFEVFEEYIA